MANENEGKSQRSGAGDGKRSYGKGAGKGSSRSGAGKGYARKSDGRFGERKGSGKGYARKDGDSRGGAKKFDRSGDGKKFDRKDGERKQYDRKDGGSRKFDRKDGERDERRGGTERGFKGSSNRGSFKGDRAGRGGFDKKGAGNAKRNWAPSEGYAERKKAEATTSTDADATQAPEIEERIEVRERRRHGEGYRGTGAGFKRPRKSDTARIHVTPGRQAACQIGRIVRERNAFVSEVTPVVLARFEGITPEDAAFATKLARGVASTVGTLDEFINRNMKTPDDIQADVRDAMRVSAYEMLFLDKPPYVVVDQGVELVCSVAPKAGGLANAVLRRMSENAKAFPFGNPNLSLQVLARSQAFPMWLAKRLMNEMTLPKATDFMRTCNTDAAVYLAINSIKGDFVQVEEAFDQAGSLLEKSDAVDGCYRVKEPRALRSADVRALFEDGKVLVSDEAAQVVAALAMPQTEPASFLELGSGRGTKTVVMQSIANARFGHCVPMTSVDDHEFKGKVLAQRCAAYGIDTVTPVTLDARNVASELEPESFDAVLLDAPCSGVGTLRRHPEIRWRLTAEDITQMASGNLDLLIEAAKMVKVGGCVTYATCTVFEEENEQVVDRFLKTKAGECFEIDAQVATTLTKNGSDAHFAVRLKRVR